MRPGMLKNLLLSVLASVLVFGGCAKYEQIEVTSVGVQTVTADGLRGLRAELLVGIDNPAGKVAVSEIEAEIFHSGKVLGRVSLAPFILDARTDKTYNLTTRMVLDENISLFDVMKLAKGNALAECTVNFSAKVKISGVSKKIRKTDMPVDNFLKLFN